MFYLCPVNTVQTLRRIPVCSYDWEVVVVTFDTVLYCTVLYCTVLYCMVVVTFDTGESPSPAGSLLMQTETELFSHPQTEAFYQPRTGTFSLPKMWMFMPEKSSLLTQWRTRIFSQPKTEIFSQWEAEPVSVWAQLPRWATLTVELLITTRHYKLSSTCPRDVTWHSHHATVTFTLNITVNFFHSLTAI